MDSNPQSVKPISDDQELAKVLAGINQHAEQDVPFETPATSLPAVSGPVTDPVLPATDSTPQSDEETIEAAVEPLPTPTVIEDIPTITLSPPTSSATPDLTSIKNDALNDLRPLVDKLDIPADEKFDTYLLLIRSTDDKTLIAPAYAAAQSISDEARKAQALLDVIKEIDYLSKQTES